MEYPGRDHALVEAEGGEDPRRGGQMRDDGLAGATDLPAVGGAGQGPGAADQRGIEDGGKGMVPGPLGGQERGVEFQVVGGGGGGCGGEGVEEGGGDAGGEAAVGDGGLAEGEREERGGRGLSAPLDLLRCESANSSTRREKKKSEARAKNKRTAGKVALPKKRRGLGVSLGRRRK